MKSYKTSDYNYTIDTDKGLLIYNTLFNSMALIHDLDLVNQYYSIDNSTYLNDTLNKDLINAHFVTLTDTNELSILKDKYNEKCLNQKNLHLILLPCMSCNLRCKYCYENHETNDMSHETWDNLKIAIKNHHSKYALSSITISWFGGEPLLKMDEIYTFSKWLISFCDDNGIEYISSITTNGYLLNKMNIERLIECKIYGYQITLDGTKETHDSLRILKDGTGTWDTIVNNLFLLRDTNCEFLDVTIRINFNYDVIESVENLIQFVQDNFDKNRFNIGLYPINPQDNPNFVQLDDVEIGLISTFYMKYLSDRDMPIHSINHFFTEFGLVCYGSKANSLVIYPDGRIMKCSVALDCAENVVGTIQNGEFEITHKRLFETWTEIDWEKIQAEGCNKCRLLPLCIGKYCGWRYVVTKKNVKKDCPIQSKFFDEHLLGHYRSFTGIDLKKIKK